MAFTEHATIYASYGIKYTVHSVSFKPTRMFSCFTEKEIGSKRLSGWGHTSS